MLTVHILKYGRAYCGIAGVPREWPEGHRWVSFQDHEVDQLANCAECIAKKAEETDGNRNTNDR